MTSLIQALEQQATEQQAADMAVYNELVRADEGKAADVKRLDAVRQRLGKTIDDMRADQAALRQAGRLAQEAEKATPELAERVEAASDLYTEYVAETEKIAQERKAEANRLYFQFQIVQGQQARAIESRGQLAALKQKHPALFGLPAPEPATAPAAPLHFSIVPPPAAPERLVLETAHPWAGPNGELHFGEPRPSAEPAD